MAYRSGCLAKGEDCAGPDLIYLPELTFDLDNFMERIRELLAKKPSVVVAVPREFIWKTDGMSVSWVQTWLRRCFWT